MAKKSRRERKAESLAAPTAPRMSTSATMTPTAPPPAAPRPVTMPVAAPAAAAPTSRAPRPSAATADAPARIPPKEMVQEWLYVRKDLRHILILAAILFGALIVLSLTLPRLLGY